MKAAVSCRCHRHRYAGTPAEPHRGASDLKRFVPQPESCIASRTLWKRSRSAVYGITHGMTRRQRDHTPGLSSLYPTIFPTLLRIRQIRGVSHQGPAGGIHPTGADAPRSRMNRRACFLTRHPRRPSRAHVTGRYWRPSSTTACAGKSSAPSASVIFSSARVCCTSGCMARETRPATFRSRF
jgi:hypothetical protein